jgi:HPt (histidine-containing phosphotransfer) domain-containing protein
MPVMDGLEAAQKLKINDCKTPIIALTANVMLRDRDAETYSQHGIAGQLGKPFVPQELWVLLKKYLKLVKMVPYGQELLSAAPDEYRLLPNNDSIDTQFGLKMSSGDEKLYKRLLVNFYNDNKNFMPELYSLIKKGDIRPAHRMTHTIKSVSGLIGATKLQKAAYVIEKSLSGNLPNYTAEQIKTFESALQDVLSLLSNLSADSPATVHHPPASGMIDKNAALLLLNKLTPLVKAGSLESGNLTGEIRKNLEPLGEHCARLIQQIEDYEFEQAENTIVEIRKILEMQHG